MNDVDSRRTNAPRFQEHNAAVAFQQHCPWLLISSLP
jgi:hypothetical protein